ncbi:MAG: nucleotidyltransferase domain-containing protein [Anaerolineales bacterium]|nr:nucleotidyltransferase domain-containing protein [Anaerolineales bacterium]
MALTIEDYEQTLAAFTAYMANHQEQLRSVMLYGSMARGEVVPGHSDLDFWVFVRQAEMRDEARFARLLTDLVGAAQILADSGLPVIHAFCYYADDELGWLPQALVPNLSQPVSGRAVVGDHLGGQIGSTSASRILYRLSYFLEMRRQVFLPLAIFLGRTDFSDREASAIFAGLKYLKYIPEAACGALDIWSGEEAAPQQLAEALPELDMRVVSDVMAARLGGELLQDPIALATLLRRSLQFIEAIYDELTRQGCLQPDFGGADE